MVGSDKKDCYVGDEARNPSNPIECGKVVNWDDMEKVWHHMFYNELRISPDEKPVLLSQPPQNPHADKERITQIMFETFDVPAMYLAEQAALAIYSAGQTSGLVLDSGHGITHAVPVNDGFAIQHAVTRLNFAGNSLTTYLQKLLAERGYSLTTTSDQQVVCDIKEKLCYIASSFDIEMHKATESKVLEKTYELPDGNALTIGSERFRCPEALFQPGQLGIESPGIHEAIYKSIMSCDEVMRPHLYDSIFLCGGSTMFSGIQERVNKDIVALAPPGTKVEVTAPAERKYSNWIGGSILASLESFEDQFITQDEYQETGPQIVHRKCY